MKYVISATDRPGSRSRIIANIVKQEYLDQGEEVEIIDMAELDFRSIEAPYSKDNKPPGIQEAADKVLNSEGLHFVVPEYNGSYPGILKYFIDHWAFPDAFEARPVCFIGLGGRWGGLRPVEHLQGVFSYRNSFIFPERIFISNIWSTLQEGRIEDDGIRDLLKSQVSGFRKFVSALDSAQLSAQTREVPQ